MIRIYKRGAFKGKRHKASYYPNPLRFRKIASWFILHFPAILFGLRFAAVGLVILHLMMAAFFPGGKNDVSGWEAPHLFGYLNLAPVGDTMGFFKTSGMDGFFVYKIFTDEGKVVEGSFPDPKVTPRLRYDRWAMFGHHASENNPYFHSLFLDYLINRLPISPLKVDLLSARWDWPGRKGFHLNSGENGGMGVVLKKLGTYDGLNREWTPAGKKKGK